ncbi:hypothetical protein HK104_007455 [Borealophlyctis nickersoniae]|nr:hypothetical protein HK104_007455 [Borealophlyctis nickersoniae]
MPPTTAPPQDPGRRVKRAEPRAPQLTIDPPLPPSVDEGDVLIALRSFPGFSDIHFYPNFFLATFDELRTAQNALSNINEKLAAPIKIRWDVWGADDPQKGPFPDVSPAVESQFVFLPRSFMKDGAIIKIVKQYPGFVAGRNALEGYIVKFRDVPSARHCIEDIIEVTNLLPFFCGPEGKPVKPVAELDEYAKDLNGTNGKVAESNTIWLSPMGGSLDVLFNFVSSFYGWQRAYFDGTEDCALQFEDKECAKRAMNYINHNTPAQSWFAESDFPKPAPPTDTGAPNVQIHIGLGGQVDMAKKKGKKRIVAWIQRFQGTEQVKHTHSRCCVVRFVDEQKAQAALNEIHRTTNFSCHFCPTGGCPPSCNLKANGTLFSLEPKMKAGHTSQKSAPSEAPTLPEPAPVKKKVPLHILHVREAAPRGAWKATAESFITMLSTFSGFIGAVPQIGGVYARFEDEKSLAGAVAAVETFTRISAQNGENTLTLTANPVTPHAIEEMLRALPHPTQEEFFPVPPKLLSQNDDSDTVPDPLPALADPVIQKLEALNLPDIATDLRSLRDKVKHAKSASTAVAGEAAKVDQRRRLLAYRVGGLEKGLAGLKDLGQHVGGEKDAKDVESKTERADAMVASAVGAAFYVAQPATVTMGLGDAPGGGGRVAAAAMM